MKTTISTIAAAVLAVSGAGAAITAIGEAPTAGNQDFGGSLGMDFDVSTTIVVTQLGAFDHNGDGINRDLGAAIYGRDNGGTPDDFADDSGLAILGPTATFTNADPGTLVGSYRFKDVEPITLVPGSYTLVGWGYGAGESNGNDGNAGNWPTTVDEGGGVIDFVGGSRFGDAAAAGEWPSSPDAGAASGNSVRYGSANMVYSAIPEPSAAGLFVLGGLSLALRRKRR
jgi:hypothetical protein